MPRSRSRNTRRGHRRVPAFLPVPLRARRDGWTPMRQAAFLGALAESRCVRAAARRVGLARETAYRLRRKPGAESFAAAWDRIMGRGGRPSRKVTPAALAHRALDGLLKPVIWRGRHVATIWKPDSSALLRFLRQLDRAGADEGRNWWKGGG